MHSSEKVLVPRNWLKRVNSWSRLDDGRKLDFEENYCGDNVDWKYQQQKAQSTSRLRTRSNNYIDDNMRLEKFLLLQEQGHDMLRRKPEKFPFQSIPDNCKLRVFSFLSLIDQGRAAQVCSEWRMLMRSFMLWDNIDLIKFPYPPVRHDDVMVAYETYKCNLQKFLCYLISIGAPMRSLRVAFDIGDHRDGWLELLQSFLRSVPCQELEFAELNWKETLARPPVTDMCCYTWCASNYNDLMYRQRHRQRLFVKFFDFFTAIAPSVQRLILPFDWSERSIQMLGRLSQLRILVLDKYFLYQGLDQQLIDQLMLAAPRLTHLTLDVRTPSGNGLQLYKMHSSSLRFLDISQCCGFCLMDVDLPNLEELHVTRSPLFGPIISNDQLDVPCLGQVLWKGAGRLRKLNCHRLTDSWLEATCQEFDLVLKSICSCKKHKLVK